MTATYLTAEAVEAAYDMPIYIQGSPVLHGKRCKKTGPVQVLLQLKVAAWSEGITASNS